MKPSLIIIGGGGHCASIIDVIEQENIFKISGIVDRKERLGEDVCHYKINYTDDDLDDLVCKFQFFFLGLGQIKSSLARRNFYERIQEKSSYKAIFPIIKSPRAYVSPHAVIQEGSIIMHDALVNARSVIGKNAIINTKALVEHDCIIEDFCHISTGAILNGNCYLGSDSFIGSQSVIREGITIPSKSIIGAGEKIKRPPEQQI